MIHFLQCLWWEWRWRRLKVARALVMQTLPFALSSDDFHEMIATASRLERDMAALERKMRVRP